MQFLVVFTAMVACTGPQSANLNFAIPTYHEHIGVAQTPAAVILILTFTTLNVLKCEVPLNRGPNTMIDWLLLIVTGFCLVCALVWNNVQCVHCVVCSNQSEVC